MKKKLLSMALVLLLVLALLPASALASQGKILGWNYASIVPNGYNNGYSIQKASGSNDLSRHVHVSYNGTDVSIGNLSMAMSSDATGNVTVTCDSGYYIAYIVLCCHDGSGYSCKTSAGDNAYGWADGTASATSVSLSMQTLRQKANHGYQDSQGRYWLMVMLKPTPNPVYVGYDAGSIGGTALTAAAVDTAAAAPSGSVWVSGYTALQYAWTGSVPTHTALSVSDAAAAEALAMGYVFDGWSLTYYTEYSGGNSFAGQVGSVADVAAGGAVPLNVHAKLTARWTAAPAVDVTVRKEWDDAGDQDGMRADSVQVQLYAGNTPVGKPVTLNAANDWTYTWEDQPAQAYTVDEITSIPGYTKEVTKTQNGDWLVTNCHVPEQVDVTAEKTWVGDERYGYQPDSIAIQLYADGEAWGDPVTIDAESGWAYTWKDLDKYAGGEEIVYTAKEVDVPDNYKATEVGLTITNTLQVFDFDVWKYNPCTEEPIDGVKFALYDNAECTGTPLQTGITETAENEDWNLRFKGLDPNKTYYLKETAAADGYIPDETIYEIRDQGDWDENYYRIANIPAAVIEIGKEWNDAGDQDAIRPGSVQVQLYADGEAFGDPIILTEADGWQAVAEVPMFRLDSSEDEEMVVPVRYTVQELAVEGYTAEIREELTAYEDSETMYAAYRFVVTNTHTPGTIDVTVQKNWVDGNSKDRPGSVTVQLYADGQACGEPVTLTKEDGWTYTWHVPAKNGGRDVVYTVKETGVPKGYKATYSEDTLTITNTLQEIPATGDSSALWLYTGIFAVSAAAAAVFLIFRKKRRQE